MDIKKSSKYYYIKYSSKYGHLVRTNLESKLEWVESISNDSLRVSRVDFYRLTLNTIYEAVEANFKKWFCFFSAHAYKKLGLFMQIFGILTVVFLWYNRGCVDAQNYGRGEAHLRAGHTQISSLPNCAVGYPWLVSLVFKKHPKN